MFKRTFTAGLALGIAVIAAPSAEAQNNCGPRDLVIERLSEKYTERLTGGGLQNQNTFLEVWTSDKTGSFTVLMSYATGMTCIVATGHNWSSVAKISAPEGTAS